MEEPLNELRWLALGQVLVGQLLHGADERLNCGNVFPGVTVSFAFVAARDGIQRRHQQKAEDRRHQHDER